MLIVEDSVEDREVYRRELAHQYDLMETDSGEEALRLFAQRPPDCVLIDYSLGDTDAIEFLRQLKGEAPGFPTAVVIVTGQGSERIAVQAMKLGVEDYVIKGAQAQLASVVATAIARYTERNVRSYRILIVDDNPDDRVFYRRRLPEGQPGRYEFKEAETCAEGLALCREWRPDCVLLDYALPDADGLELLVQLRSEPESAGTAVVVLTGQGNEAVAVEALKLGAQDYVVKSSAIEALRLAVHGGVDKMRLQRKIDEQRHELAQSQQALKDFVENATVGLAWLGEDGTILWANRAHIELLGYEERDFIGRPIVEFFSEPNGANELMRTLRSGESLRSFETRMRSRDGEERTLLVDANVLWEGERRFVHARCFFRDISERRRLEEELRKRLEELRDADRRKDEFLAMLAHELRNPLAPLLNALDILRKSALDPATGDFAMRVLDRQLRHMARLVDDLLDVSRITRGLVNLKAERLDLVPLVKTVVADHSSAIDVAGLVATTHSSERPVWVHGDRIRVAQILGNLLSNAIKFSARGGEVRITVTADQAAMKALVVVEDQGQGIERDMLPRIFEIFSQADRSLERQGGGLGLGLAIVRELVRLHGGAVSVSSEGSGKGARFEVSFPLQAEPAPLTTVPSRRQIALSGKRVLVVEDNQDAAKTLKVLLELHGYVVTLAATGPEGLRVADQWLPEVVLCDIGLPGMDGFRVAQEMRHRSAVSGARLIALTGYGGDVSRSRALEAGFDSHLVKPADPDALIDTIEGVST